jgi:hypothetical protein
MANKIEEQNISDALTSINLLEALIELRFRWVALLMHIYHVFGLCNVRHAMNTFISELQTEYEPSSMYRYCSAQFIILLLHLLLLRSHVKSVEI